MTNLFNFAKQWRIIVAMTLIFAVFGFVISKVQTPKYESTTQLMVIQKYGDQFDAFSAKRSAETVAETLSTVVYSSTFMREAITAPLGVKDTFPQDLKARKQAWKKTINVKLLTSGNFQISVYDQDKDQAEKLAYAMAYVLVTNGDEYHGGGQQVAIKMVDRPITSQTPVKPNIYFNTVLGLIIGLLSSIGIAYLLPEKQGKKKALPTIKQDKKVITKIKPDEFVKKVTAEAPSNLPIVNEPTKKEEKQAVKKQYTGVEYSQDKVDEWVKTGRFNH